METCIRTYLERITVGRRQTWKNLALFPLFCDQEVFIAYLILDEALREGSLEISEVHESGSVPEITIENTSSLPVLIVDGEELVGAKQNRVVNTTILLKRKSRTTIPVSCVEQGRWSYSSATFSSEDRLMSSRLRARKAEQVHRSIRSSGSYRSDQGVIWQHISELAERRNAVSPSMAMAEIYKRDQPLISDYLRHFQPVDRQTGALYMINGRIAGVELFGSSTTFTKYYEKLLESYALDAVDEYGPQAAIMWSRLELNAFMQNIAAADIDTHDSVGEGTDCRLSSEVVSGFALIVDEQIVHLSAFGLSEAAPQGNAPRAAKRRLSS